jgi:hypothetical protein
MARVRCTITEVALDNGMGGKRDGVRAECMRCDKITEAVGRGEKSVKRCLVLMRQGCDLGEEGNFYIED